MKYLVLDIETEAWAEEVPREKPPRFVAMGCRYGWPDGSTEAIDFWYKRNFARSVVNDAMSEGYIIVGHNLAFDLWVLGIKPRYDDPGYWDTMIAHFLQRLAYNDGGSNPSPYVKLEELTPGGISGKGDVQLSYKPGVPLTPEQEQYLRDDVGATHRLFLEQRKAGVPGGVAEISLQLRALCALNQLERNGLRLDKHELRKQQKVFQRTKKQAATELAEYGLYVPAGVGPRGGKKKAHKRPSYFQALLELCAEAHGNDIDRTPTGKAKTDKDTYSDYLHIPPVHAWDEFVGAEKALGFVDKWTQAGDTVHGRYTYLVRSGRTSSSNPNMQNIPSRGSRGDLKKVFIAPPGRVFWELDYGQLELCTFAYLTQGVMKDLINQDVDLHRFIASEIYNKAPEELTKLERQGGKAPNFGFLGGMGAKKYTTYARGYGVQCGLEEGQQIRNLWLSKYPETHDWLFDVDGEAVAPRAVRDVWAGKEWAEDKKVVRGGPTTFYHARAGDIAWPLGWERARAIGKQVPWYVVEALKKREGSPKVELWLTHREVIVAGGRKRAPVSYTEQRNTQFQGLAANLTKEALARVWADVPEAMIHAFVHDSLLISVVDDAKMLRTVERVAELMLWAARRWIPDVLVHVEAVGPGRSWYDAKNIKKEDIIIF